MSSSKKLTRKGTSRQVFVPSPPRYFFGWSSSFVGFESDQIQSDKLLQNMVSNSLHPLPATQCILLGAHKSPAHPV